MGSDRRSVGSGPMTTSRARATSRTRRPMIPFEDRSAQSGGREPPAGTRPSEGLNPASPHTADGMRIDPPPSDPVASGTMPAATAAALPPDEPPADLDGSHGLRVDPNSGLVVSAL